MGGFLVLVGCLGILVGLINVVYPIRKLKITSRKMAAAVLGASFVIVVVGGILLPPSEPASEPAEKAATDQAPAADKKPEAQRETAAATQPATTGEVNAESTQTTQVGTVAATSATTATPRTATVPVVSVTDGDTIKVSIGGTTETVRLIGVDTPETVHPSKPVEPYGPEASTFTKRRLSGQNVRLEFDVEERDHYGRLLAYVWIANELFNATLVKDGYAQVLTIPPNVKYADQFVALQREARENNRGLWGLGATAQQPAPAPAPAPAPSAPSAYYKNCTAARAAGVTPLYRGQPGYGKHLDRDGDGVACE